MTKSFCDRCEKETGKEELVIVLGGVKLPDYPVRDAMPSFGKETELCPDCYQEFEEFLGGKK